VVERFSKFFVIILLFFTSDLWAQATNIEMLTQLADSLIDSFMAAQLSESSSSVLLRKGDPGNASNWFLQDRFVEACQNRNQKVFISEGEKEAPWQDGYLLQFNGLDVGTAYDNFKENPKRLRRSVTIKMAVLLARPLSGEVMWRGNLAGQHADLIDADQINAVENDNIPFTVGVRETKSKSVKLVQPVAVSATAGLVIFLFYSLRSR